MMTRLVIIKSLSRWTTISALLISIGLITPSLLNASYRNLGSLAITHEQYPVAIYWLNQYSLHSGHNLLNQVKVSVLTKNFVGAEQFLHSTFINRDTMMPLFFLETASRFLDEGDRSNALSTLGLISSLNQVDSEWIYEQGLLYERAGDNEQAQHSFTIGASKDPAGRLAMGWYYLARSHYRAGAWEQVIDLLTPIYASVPFADFNVNEYWRESFLFMAWSQENLGQTSEAEQTYRDLVALNPASRDGNMHLAQLHLGTIELQRGNWKAAQNDFVIAYDCAVLVVESAREAYEEQAMQGLSDVAGSIASQGQITEALTLSQQSVLSDPKSPGWRVMIGLLYKMDCKADKTLEAYKMALALAPQSVTLPKIINDSSENPPSCSP